MSIYKNEQHDNRTLWEWIKGFFGEKCISYVHPSGVILECEKRMGHSGRHSCGKTSWGYGDNWITKEKLK